MKQYDPVLYQAEKDIGLRNPNGSSVLKKLTPVHKRMIELHLRGHKIADICELLHTKYGTVQRVLHDPIAVEFINGFDEILNKEFNALRMKATEAVRSGLDSGDNRTKLIAARLFYDRKGELGGASSEDGKMTAEDVVQLILAKIDINVNIGSNEPKEVTYVGN